MAPYRENMHAKEFDRDARGRAVFGVIAFTLVHSLFTLGQIMVTRYSDLHLLLNMNYWAVSIAVNALTDVVCIGFLLAAWRGSRWFQKKGFYPFLVLLISTVSASWLVHMHFTGTQSNVAIFLFITTWLVSSWFLTSRHSWTLFWAGHAGIAALLVLEWNEILPYAPLLAKNEQLAEVILQWRVGLGSLAIYLCTVTLVALTYRRFRSTILHANEQLKEINWKLEAEVDERRRIEAKNQALISDLRTAADAVKTLEGLLPICAGCGMVRNDKGYWNRLETYLHQHSNLQFTHGLCPDCLVRLYPDYVDREEGEGQKTPDFVPPKPASKLKDRSR